MIFTCFSHILSHWSLQQLHRVVLWLLRTKLMNLFLLTEQQGAAEHISSGSNESDLGIMKSNPAERLDCSATVWSWGDHFWGYRDIVGWKWENRKERMGRRRIPKSIGRGFTASRRARKLIFYESFCFGPSLTFSPCIQKHIWVRELEQAWIWTNAAEDFPCARHSGRRFAYMFHLVLTATSVVYVILYIFILW